MSPAYGDKEDKRINNILHFDSGTNKYYIITVDVIDRNSLFDDKVLAAELLLDKISDSTIFEYCYDDSEIEIYDKEIREYFESKYGDVE
jgi:hypothetical protein